jgi:hypothetical protein
LEAGRLESSKSPEAYGFPAFWLFRVFVINFVFRSMGICFHLPDRAMHGRRVCVQLIFLAHHFPGFLKLSTFA